MLCTSGTVLTEVFSSLSYKSIKGILTPFFEKLKYTLLNLSSTFYVSSILVYLRLK